MRDLILGAVFLEVVVVTDPRHKSQPTFRHKENRTTVRRIGRQRNAPRFLKHVLARVIEARNVGWRCRNAKLLALLDGEIDQERLQEAAGEIADTILRYSVYEKLNFFEVAEAGTTILGDKLEQIEDLARLRLADSISPPRRLPDRRLAGRGKTSTDRYRRAHETKQAVLREDVWEGVRYAEWGDGVIDG